MKIAFVLPQLVYGRHGGFVGGYVNSAINVVAAMQYQAEVVLLAGVAQPSPEGERELRARLNRTQLVLLPMGSRPSSLGYFVEFSWKLHQACRQLRRSGLAFVYGHSGHPGYGLATWLGARAAGALAVHALYCPVSEEFQHRKMGRLTRLLVGQAFRRVRFHVAISDNVRGTVRGFTGNRVDPHVILPAIPDDFVAASAPSPRRDLGGAVRLGFVGHHKPEKGFDLALDALRDAVASGCDVSLLAVASGAESQGSAAETIKRMISDRGLEERVRLVSGINDMRDFYAQLDLLLIPFRGTRGPSDYPMVLLEAMSLGLPVVCTAVGAIPEVVKPGENGFLARQVNAPGFSAALAEATAGIATRREELCNQATAAMARFRATQVSKDTLEYLTSLNPTTKR